MMSLELFSLVGAILSLILVAVYRYLVRPYDFFEMRGIPGPVPRAVFGTWAGLWNKAQGEEDVQRLTKFGTIYGEYAGRSPVLVTAEPSVVRAVLQDHTSQFRSRRANCVRDKYLQQGLLALEAKATKTGPEVPMLSKESIKKLMPRILNCTSHLTSQASKTAEAAEGKIEVSGLVSDYLGKILVNAVLGHDESGEKVIDEKLVSKHLKHAFFSDNPDSPLAAIPFIYPSLVPLDKFILKPKAAKFFTSLLLAKIQEKVRAEKADQDRQLDLVDILLQTRLTTKTKDSEEEGKTEETMLQTKEFAFVQSLGVLLHSSLVSQRMVSAGVVMLAGKPEIQERLHDELYQRLEAADTYDLVNNSEFLDAFVAEVLRLYPVEYRIERECCETIQLEKIKIEKGLIVSIPVYALHRQSQFYPEPENFTPERFSHENKEKLESFAFVPFGQTGESVSNISIQWSILVAKLAIASLIKQFKFVPAEETKLPPLLENGVTGVPRLQPIFLLAESRK